MIIVKKTRGISKYLKHLKKGDKYWLGLPYSSDRSLDEQLKSLGFSIPLISGECALPSGEIGPACKRNAHGYDEIHKDQPKETAYRQMEWHWKEFNGPYDTVERSKIVDVPYKRYPRTNVPPYGIDLAISSTKEGNFILAGPFIVGSDDHERSTNTVNVFIELFSQCCVLNENMETWQKTPLRRLNWELLPQGKNPWAEAQPALTRIIKNTKLGNQPVIQSRFDTIEHYSPEFIAIGNGGFSGYVVFGFPSLGLCVLESVKTNNATYILNESSWENISALSKAEILNEELHSARIIHRESWYRHIGQILANRQAS